MAPLYKPFVALATRWKDRLVSAWRRDELARARVWLTVLYLAISSVLLAVFSVLLYRGLSVGIAEAIRDQVLDPRIQRILFDRAQQSLQNQILLLDLGALVVIAVCAYLITGKTLAPVRTARERERRFVADAAHELRTPLTVMKSGIEVVERFEKDMSPRVATLLADTRTEIDELTRTANDLLALVDLTNDAKTARSHCDVRDILETATTRLRPHADKAGVTLDTSLPDTTRSYMTRGNKDQLTRVYENIIENAIKYTPRGGTVTVTLTPHTKTLVTTVADTGVGIAPEDLPHITKAFYRSDSARAHATGSGLGLAIVARTLDAHSGSLEIQSELGTGTKVNVTLPRV